MNNKSDNVGCYVLKRYNNRLMVLIHKRSEYIDHPNFLSGPGGSREKYKKNYLEALNT